MKLKSSKWYVVLSLAILVSMPWSPQDAYSQTYFISEVNFELVGSKPQDTLKLRISLSPSNTKEKDVSINLTIRTDQDNDCKCADPEEVKHQEIKIKDNEKGKDEALVEGVILTYIADIPLEHPWQKYVARVTYGEYSKVTYKVIPSSPKTVCDPSNIPSGFRKIFRIPMDVANELKLLKTFVKRDSRENNQERQSLYVYSRNDKKSVQVVGQADRLS